MLPHPKSQHPTPVLETPMDGGALWAAVHGVAESWTRLSDFTLTFHFQALEKETATHSSVLAWRIPGTGEPGGLLSMGSQSRKRLKRLSSSSSTPRASLPVYLCRRHQVWESGILDDFYNLGTFTQAARYPQKSDYLSTGQLRRESYRSRAHPLANLSDVLSCLTSPGITLCRIMGKGEQCF